MSGYLRLSSDQKPNMNTVPPELIAEIARLAPRQERLALLKTCKTIRDIAQRFLYGDLYIGANQWQQLLQSLCGNEALPKLVRKLLVCEACMARVCPNNAECEALSCTSCAVPLTLFRADVFFRFSNLEHLVLDATTLPSPWVQLPRLQSFEWGGCVDDAVFKFLVAHPGITDLTLQTPLGNAGPLTMDVLPNLQVIDVWGIDIKLLLPGRPIGRVSMRSNPLWTNIIEPSVGPIPQQHLSPLHSLAGAVHQVETVISIPPIAEALENILFWEMNLSEGIFPNIKNLVSITSRLPSLQRLACAVFVLPRLFTPAEVRRVVDNEESLALWYAANAGRKAELELFHYCGPWVCRTFMGGKIYGRATRGLQNAGAGPEGCDHRAVESEELAHCFATEQLVFQENIPPQKQTAPDT
ncbi:hypothetical protein C8R43DRAFT_1142613 [Mycena crocata]|nr:hypothetical protein C8R43DRAFT_1142613 [Mycena crocata]